MIVQPQNYIETTDVTPRLAGMQRITEILQNDLDQIKDGILFLRPSGLMIYSHVTNGIDPSQILLGRADKIDGELKIFLNQVGFPGLINDFPDEHITELEKFFRKKEKPGLNNNFIDESKPVEFTSEMLNHMAQMVNLILPADNGYVIVQNQKDIFFPFVVYKSADEICIFAVHDSLIAPEFAQVAIKISQKHVYWKISDYWCTPANILNSLIKHINPEATELYPDDNYRGAAPLGIE